MKTKKEIVAQMAQLKRSTEYYATNASQRLMNQGSINALEWVLE